MVRTLEEFLSKRLRLRVNRAKSAVDRPWKRKFLGYSMTAERTPRLKVAPESERRLREKLKAEFRRGRNLGRHMQELRPLLIGWSAYFRYAEVKTTFERLDEWIRRRFRCVQWRQWKKPRTRAAKLISAGLSEGRAYNGHGPWWNAGASHLNAALLLHLSKHSNLTGGKTIEQLDVGVNPARAAIEASHAQHFAGGGSLKSSLEIGGRFDGGDGETGAGLEVGGGLTCADPGSGLTVAAGSRGLLIRDGNYGEWGLSGLIRLIRTRRATACR